MKRPKMPQLRIPKKYRDGKLFAALFDAFEKKQTAALAMEDPVVRFEALARLEKKINAQFMQASHAIYGTKNRQTSLSVAGSGVTGIGLIVASLAVAPPLAPVFLIGGSAVGFGGMFGTMIGQDISLRRGLKSKNQLHPVAALEQLRTLLSETKKELVATALENPLPLIEKPRFQKLCENTPDVAKALTQAFVKAQTEKPVSPSSASPDLTNALSKPRLPQVKK